MWNENNGIIDKRISQLLRMNINDVDGDIEIVRLDLLSIYRSANA